MQTLCGDTTDNIPGVKGVGPKKAAALIAKYGTAAAVIEHANELTPAMKANVLEFAPDLERTRQLVTLRQDVPVEFDLEACRWRGVNDAALLPIVRQLGFTRSCSRSPSGLRRQARGQDRGATSVSETDD